MSKSRIEMQIEAAQKKIQDEQKRLKQLQNQQSEMERKARTHRMCKRHGYQESVLPELADLTDEQFEAFVKQHIANQHGRRALANIIAQGTDSTLAKPTETEQENGGGNVPAGAGKNNAAATTPQGANSVTKAG
jgi:ATP-dependent Clp protease ATP-binding subunit ClpA